MTGCNRQEDRESIIQENTPDKFDEEFKIENLIGRVIEGKYYSRERYPIKMRKIEL